MCIHERDLPPAGRLTERPFLPDRLNGRLAVSRKVLVHGRDKVLAELVPRALWAPFSGCLIRLA